jgi:CBS domain-containing protein
MPDTTVMQAKRLGVLTCTPETTLLQAAQRMTGEDVSALVVVDEEGYLAGIVTRTDLLRARHEPRPWVDRTVDEVMNPQVVTVGVNATLAEVTELLLNERIHRVVVVRHDGREGPGAKARPLSVISAADIIYDMVKTESRARSVAGP